MKKVLIISAVFPPEPVVSASLSFDIATSLAEDNMVTVISPSPTRPEGFDFSNNKEKEYNFKHIISKSFTFPKSKFFGRMKESYSFGRFCNDFIVRNHENIDVIYQNSWPIFSQYFIYKAAKKFNIPLVTHIMDVYPESLIEKLPFFKSLFYFVLLPFDKRILRYSNKIICISGNMKKYLENSRNIDENKLEIVNNWQDEESFIIFNEKKVNSDKKRLPFTFMYLGNNGPVAGVEFLIEAFVKANVNHSRLVIAGSGSKTEDCKKLVQKLNAENIEFIPVPEGKVPEIQDLADVMLLPVKKNAAYSSIPSKLPAYMFSAKPILGSLDTDSDTALAIINADAGIVVEPENEDKLIVAFNEIATWEYEKLIQKGQNAYKYSMNNFSKSENLKKIVDIILKIKKSEN